MTPHALLTTVKLRFPVLLHDDEAALDNLLVQALGTYQDKAGCINSTTIAKSGDNSLTRALPADYLAMVGVVDSEGSYVCSSIVDSQLILEPDCYTSWPLKFMYLVNLREMDLDKGTVPPNIIGKVQNYLEALIAIPNIERLRRVSIAGKYDVMNLPDESTLYERARQLEEDMANHRAILPMFTS